MSDIDIAEECEHRIDKTKTKDVLRFAVALDEWAVHLSQPEAKAAMPISNIPDLLALAADTITTQSARIATLERLVREAMPYVEHSMMSVKSYHVLTQTAPGDYHGDRWLSAAREAVGEGAK